MAFDEGLAQRLNELLADQPGVTEKKMFGGYGLLVRGNMCCGILGERLIARVGPQKYAEALRQPHVKEFNFTGRPMKGWVYVDAAGTDSDEDLERWVRQALDYVLTLPAK